jgi:hypothetical protein
VLQLRDVDQQRIVAAGTRAKFALLLGSPWPDQFAWIMADNTLLPLDAVGMSAMADAAAAHVTSLMLTARAHKTAIAALDSVAAVEAYDISAGWV